MTIDEMMPLAYEELHRLARKYMGNERQGHTLQATALINEAYIRLVEEGQISVQDRAQFFGIAARRMRQILIEHARRRGADKRGGGEYKLTLSKADNFVEPLGGRVGRLRGVNLAEERVLDLIAFNEVIERLEAIDALKATIVDLRVFGGLTTEEIANALDTSAATVKRHWEMARAWLRGQFGKVGEEGAES